MKHWYTTIEITPPVGAASPDAGHFLTLVIFCSGLRSRDSLWWRAYRGKMPLLRSVCHL